MLVQDHETLRCVIGFAGINNYGNELATATNVQPGQFCGFEGVHVGYRDELRRPLGTDLRGVFEAVSVAFGLDFGPGDGPRMVKHLFPKLRKVMGKCRRDGRSTGGLRA